MPHPPVILLPLLWLAAPVELHLVAPEQCPQRSEFVAQVEALLQHPLESKVGVTGVEVTLEALSAGYRLQLAFFGTSAVDDRRLEDASCPALVEAAALIIAIALDPEAMGEAPPPPRPRPPPIDGLLAPGIPFEIPYPRFAFGVLGGLDQAWSGPGLDLYLSSAILWGRLRFELLLGRAFPRSNAAGQVGLWSAGGRACVDLLALGALELPLCPGLELGIFEAEPPGGPVRREPWVAGTLSASLLLVLAAPVALRITGEGLGPFTRPEGPDGVLPGAVEFRGQLGAEVRFP